MYPDPLDFRHADPDPQDRPHPSREGRSTAAPSLRGGRAASTRRPAFVISRTGFRLDGDPSNDPSRHTRRQAVGPHPDGAPELGDPVADTVKESA